MFLYEKFGAKIKGSHNIFMNLWQLLINDRPSDLSEVVQRMNGTMD